MAAISENIETLISRLEEQKLQDPVFQPTPYWENYTGRIVKGIQIRGLGQFRADYEIAKGYGAIQPLAAEFPWEKLSDINILHKIKNYLNINVQRTERSATAYYQNPLNTAFATFNKINTPREFLSAPKIPTHSESWVSQ